ncbi:MAG: hypothetical protein C0480_10120 [Bradyrhizobium sp.]|nr:hypothetical protein [Bradyrhizobium sp.]
MMLRKSVLKSIVARMGMTMARLTFTETLVLHAIRGRSVNGVAVATDRLIAVECALSPGTVRAVRRDLQAADLLDARMVTRGRVEADDEYEIVIRAPEPAAAS